jgi:hypothetical protein
MDPQLKIALEAQAKVFISELDKRFEAHDAKWELRFGDLERTAASASDQLYDFKTDIINDVTARMESFDANAADRLAQVDAATKTRVAALESTTAAFENWRPSMESAVDDVRYGIDLVQAETSKMNIHWDQAVRASASSKPGILGDPRSVLGRPPAGQWTDGPAGHRNETHRRENGYGCSDTQTHLPPNGTPNIHVPLSPNLFGSLAHQIDGQGFGSAPAPNLGSLPKLHFPSFDGDNPRLWISRAEEYFDLYNVDPCVWIRVSHMHFTGSAARWWQSVERRLKGANWREFSTCLLERFGRDKHEHLIRQLFHIRQTTTIAVYIEQFFDIIDQLSAYETKTDPLFYTMRFIDGLKDTIKSSVLLHRPATLDSACALAQLQEEVMEPSRSDARKSFYARGSSIQQPLPLPRPPPSDRLPTDGGKRPQTPRPHLGRINWLR